MKKVTKGYAVCNIFFAALSLIFIIPFIYIISISLSKDSAISQYGYTIIPKVIDTSGYRYIFSDMTQLINSYRVTLIFSLCSAFGGLVVMSLLAFPLSRREFKYRNAVMFVVYFTMLFSGGLIPSYIINTQFLHLGNSMWIYILPSLVSPFYVIILRTFFSDIPPSLIESAKIDGAGEYRILFKIVLPLSKPVLATVALLTLLGQWNNWYTSLIYIRSSELYSLQYLLQRILNESQFVKDMAEKAPAAMVETGAIPTENIKFAMVIVAAGPAMLIFPFFQKYFARGLTIGAVKG